MKNMVKMLGLFVLIGFSFFYSDKVIEVLKSEDEIMIELSSIEDIYGVLPVNAKIIDNTIMPGIVGRKVNINESYKKMKMNGVFNEKLLVYDMVMPDVSIRNNKDKFIVGGNSCKQIVSLVFIFDDDNYFDKINAILKNKGVVANYFVNDSYLINNSTKIKEIVNHEFYSYGDNGIYTSDNLLFSNNLISRIRDNDAILCLSTDMNYDVLKMCSENDLYTIVPTIIGKKNPYTIIKDKLSNGSIILLDMNQEVVNELGIIIDYIKGKGIKIEGLSVLLSEDVVLE